MAISNNYIKMLRKFLNQMGKVLKLLQQVSKDEKAAN